MLSPDQVPEKWSDIAGVYERAFEKLTRQFSDEAVRLLDLQPAESLVDVAAGTGSLSFAAAKAGADVLATDFSSGMIARLKQRLEDDAIHNIKAEVMDGQSLDIDDASFDVSASVVRVIFFPDIQKGLREMKRVLKDDGRCAVVCWDHPEHFEMMGHLKRAIEVALPDFEMPIQTPVWARLCGEDALQSNLLDAGFDRVEVTTMQGVLELDSAEQFWGDFTSSAPPLASLFASMGEENTEKVGKAFVELVTDSGRNLKPKLTAQACIGIAYV